VRIIDFPKIPTRTVGSNLFILLRPAGIWLSSTSIFSILCYRCCSRLQQVLSKQSQLGSNPLLGRY